MLYLYMYKKILWMLTVKNTEEKPMKVLKYVLYRVKRVANVLAVSLL